MAPQHTATRGDFASKNIPEIPAERWFHVLNGISHSPYNSFPCHAKNKQTKKSGCFMLFHLFISFNRCAPGQSWAKAPACRETDETQRCSSANGRLCIPGSLGCWEVCRGGGDQGEGRQGNDVSTKVHGIKSKNTHAHTHDYIYTHVICNNYITFCHVIYRISLCCIFVLPFGRKLSLACLKTNRINDFHPVGRTKTVATIQHAAARWTIQAALLPHVALALEKTTENHQQMLNTLIFLIWISQRSLLRCCPSESKLLLRRG